MSIFKAYGLMWRNIFKYRGTAGRREYWLAVLVNAVVAALGGILVGLSVFTYGSLCYAIGMAFVLLFAVSIIPFVSLTVRRLHDVGRSGWWTCLLLAVGVGTLCLLFMCASAASAPFGPSQNQEAGVYGPPSWYAGYRPDENQNGDVYGPPEWFEEFDASENQEAGIYGMPDFDENDEDGYNPEIEMPEDVYGPPAWTDGDE